MKPLDRKSTGVSKTPLRPPGVTTAALWGPAWRVVCLCLIIAAMAWPSLSPAGRFQDSAAQQKSRDRMVSKQIADRGIQAPQVLNAMRQTPRHFFVPSNLSEQAYADRPLPIGEGQTISQPYIVALMTELLAPTGDHRILEIGTGSGYQAAVLAAIVKKVYTIEIKPVLFSRTRDLLHRLSYDNIVTRHGDGYYGWPEEAPFDGIVITASVDHIPPPLIQQLSEGGKLVLPLGNPLSYQNLVVVTKQKSNIRLEQITGVLFVPMTGRALKGSHE
jgi:protein-L-isoaspartate(D-aspartate) O-methyltransferase